MRGNPNLKVVVPRAVGVKSGRPFFVAAGNLQQQRQVGRRCGLVGQAYHEVVLKNKLAGAFVNRCGVGVCGETCAVVIGGDGQLMHRRPRIQRKERRQHGADNHKRYDFVCLRNRIVGDVNGDKGVVARIRARHNRRGEGRSRGRIKERAVIPNIVVVVRAAGKTDLELNACGRNYRIGIELDLVRVNAFRCTTFTQREAYLAARIQDARVREVD